MGKLIRTKRPNLLVGVPTLFDALSRDPSLRHADLSCLRATFSGANTLPRPVKQRFEALVRARGGRVQLLEGYGLTEACVVGVPDPEQIERVKAYVVLKDPAKANAEMEKTLIETCRASLIKWSCPREVEFRRELPKTRIGKVDYKVLVAEDVAKAGGKEVKPVQNP